MAEGDADQPAGIGVPLTEDEEAAINIVAQQSVGCCTGQAASGIVRDCTKRCYVAFAGAVYR